MSPTVKEPPHNFHAGTPTGTGVPVLRDRWTAASARVAPSAAGAAEDDAQGRRGPGPAAAGQLAARLALCVVPERPRCRRRGLCREVGARERREGREERRGEAFLVFARPQF